MTENLLSSFQYELDRAISRISVVESYYILNYKVFLVLLKDGTQLRVEVKTKEDL